MHMSRVMRTPVKQLDASPVVQLPQISIRMQVTVPYDGRERRRRMKGNMMHNRLATDANPLSSNGKRRMVIKAYHIGSVAVATLLISAVIIITTAAATATAYAEVQSSSSLSKSTSYGMDVSFPIRQDHVTTNYDWLPHNTLPKLYPAPEGYVGMPIQPLGNRQEFYSEYIRGCIDHYVSRFFVSVFSVSVGIALERMFGFIKQRNGGRNTLWCQHDLTSLTLYLFSVSTTETQIFSYNYRTYMVVDV